jgi:hypothetical protein
MTKRAILCAAVLSAASCATLRDVVQAPQFSVAAGRQAELRLTTGGATVRIWTNVRNPNAFGFTLARLAGSLFVENSRAANVDLPLGLPLVAQRDTVIPIDVTIRYSDLPGLADLASRLLTRSSVAYRLDGTVTVDAGVFGQPSFGPNTIVRGDVAIFR